MATRTLIELKQAMRDYINGFNSDCFIDQKEMAIIYNELMSERPKRKCK